MLNAGLSALRMALQRREVTSVALVTLALQRIADNMGEGARTFTAVYGASALQAAHMADHLYDEQGGVDRPLLGVPVSVKDLFDVAGEVTTAGTVFLRDNPPARADATIVARLRRAGAIIIGRTNMTELAFSGIGINPHYGTPSNPWDRVARRIPGGSSSGAAVSLSDGMCAAAIGSDTGGSIRIPAALCGLTGFKPTQASVPRHGAYPLSQTLDSVGPMAWNVEDCVLLFDVLSNTSGPTQPLPSTLRLVAPTNYVMEGADATVRAVFDAMLAKYENAGIAISRIAVPALDRLFELKTIGTFPAIEAYHRHRDRLQDLADRLDPGVLRRIRSGGQFSPGALDRLRVFRAETIAHIADTLAPYDALIFPTVPMIAPPIDALADDDEFARINLLMLRNSTIVNFIDGCAVSLPIHTPGSPPVGLSIAGLAGSDRYVLGIAKQLQNIGLRHVT